MPRPSTSAVRVRAVGAQRLALATAPVQRQHVHRPQALPEGMLHRQRVQLGDDLPVTARSQVRIEAGLERGESELVQSSDLTIEEAVALHVGVRVTAPHQQRVAQPAGDLVRLDERGGGPAGDVELDRIDRRVGGSQQVAVALAHDDVPERAAQVRDVGVQRGEVRPGGVLAVHRLQQPVDRHRPAGVGDEDRKDRSLLGPTHDEHVAVVGDGVERSEHPVPHGSDDLV